MYALNLILISIFVMCTQMPSLTLDLLVNITTISIFIGICFSKLRYPLSRIVLWLPKYLLFIVTLLLLLASILAVLLADYRLFLYQAQWTGITQVFTIILLLSLCIALPILTLVAISHNQLKTQNIMYKQQLHAQAEHYQKQAESNYEIKKFKHDFKNISIGVESLIAQGDYARASEMIQNFRNAIDASSLNIKYTTGSEILDALLTDKQSIATQYNTTIQFDGCLPKNILSPTDLCIIFGNTIDNAIEACQKIDSQEPKEITIDCNSCGNVLFISIQNPIAEPVQIRDNHIQTTKKDKTVHGFGLPSLYSVVKKCDGEVKLECTSNKFTIRLEFIKM